LASRDLLSKLLSVVNPIIVIMPFSQEQRNRIKTFISTRQLKCHVCGASGFHIFGDDMCEVATVDVITGISNLVYKGMVGISCTSCGHILFFDPPKVLDNQ
jgi:hypothetical protein